MDKRGRFIPWLWLLPAFLFIAVFLVYPVVDTLRLSFMNEDSSAFVGLENYQYVFTNSATQTALLNNVLWLGFFTVLAVGLEGLGIVPAARAQSGTIPRPSRLMAGMCRPPGTR